MCNVKSAQEHRANNECFLNNLVLHEMVTAWIFIIAHLMWVWLDFVTENASWILLFNFNEYDFF